MTSEDPKTNNGERLVQLVVLGTICTLINKICNFHAYYSY